MDVQTSLVGYSIKLRSFQRCFNNITEVSGTFQGALRVVQGGLRSLQFSYFREF